MINAAITPAFLRAAVSCSPIHHRLTSLPNCTPLKMENLGHQLAVDRCDVQDLLQQLRVAVLVAVEGALSIRHKA